MLAKAIDITQMNFAKHILSYIQRYYYYPLDNDMRPFICNEDCMCKNIFIGRILYHNLKTSIIYYLQQIFLPLLFRT